MIMASITKLPTEIDNQIHSYFLYISQPSDCRGYMLSCKQLYTAVTGVVLEEYDKVIELVKRQCFENINKHVIVFKPKSAVKPVLNVFLPIIYFCGNGGPWGVESPTLQPQDYSPDPLNPLLGIYLSELKFRFYGNFGPVSDITGYPDDYRDVLIRIFWFLGDMRRGTHRIDF